MNIIIVGCGKVGISLAERLSAEGHDLVMVDISAKKIEEVTNRFDIMGVVGNGASLDIQREAGMADADVAIVIHPGNTESDYTLRLHESFNNTSLFIFRMLLDKNFKAFQNFQNCLMEFFLTRIAGDDFSVYTLQIFVVQHKF